MTSEQESLDQYQATSFYKPKDIYLDQLNIFDNRQIYPNTSLASYTQNDKIEKKARKLQEINSKKQKLLIELEMLKKELENNNVVNNTEIENKYKNELDKKDKELAELRSKLNIKTNKLTDSVNDNYIINNQSEDGLYDIDLNSNYECDNAVQMVGKKLENIDTSHEHSVTHDHTKSLVNAKEIELLKVQIEEIKVSTSNPLTN